MNRRGFVSLAVAGSLIPAATRAQTATVNGCTVGFVNGLLQFAPECVALTIPGLGFSVAPPSHLMAAPVVDSAPSVTALHDERVAHLLAQRTHAEAKQQRRRDQAQAQRQRRHDRKQRRRERGRA